MVKIEGLGYHYNNGKQMLHFPNIILKKAEHLLILGASGVGKTTLLHLIAGILPSQEGEICINETIINNLSPHKLDNFRGKNIGLIFQKNHAIQSLSIEDNLKARLFLSKKPIDYKAIATLLIELNLYDCKDSKPKHLSQGQLQRLCVALAIIHKPQLILADEPTSSLDLENSKIVIELLKEQAQKNNANLIVITHDERIKSYFKNEISL